MRDAVPYKLYIGVPRKHSSEEVAQCVILIVEDVGGASFVVLFLLDQQTVVSMVLVLY